MSERTTVREPESQWSAAPEGLHRAVCVDVWDLWQEKDTFNEGRMVTRTRLVWVIDEIDGKTNRPVEVSQMYRASLHEKSNLRHHLEAWRGRRFTDEEAKGFDLEKLIGKSCQVQVVHNLSNGKTYANVQSVVALGKGMEPLAVPPGFVRRKDRVKREDQDQTQDSNEEVCPF